MTTHILRRRKYALGATRDADGNPCAVCNSPRLEKFALDDGGAWLWEVQRCPKCNPNAVEVL